MQEGVGKMREGSESPADGGASEYEQQLRKG